MTDSTSPSPAPGEPVEPLPHNQWVPLGAPPPDYLVWAILATVLCCLPLGIPSIVFASQVRSRWQAGDTAGAQEASTRAKQYATWSAILGGLAVIVYLTVVGGLAILGSVAHSMGG